MADSSRLALFSCLCARRVAQHVIACVSRTQMPLPMGFTLSSRGPTSALLHLSMPPCLVSVRVCRPLLPPLSMMRCFQRPIKHTVSTYDQGSDGLWKSYLANPRLFYFLSLPRALPYNGGLVKRVNRPVRSLLMLITCTGT